MEGKEWIFEGGIFKEVDFETVKKEVIKVKRLGKNVAQEAYVELFEDIISSKF